MALLAGFAKWLLYPPPLDVRITVEPYSLLRYDDHDGNRPLGAVVTVMNYSSSTVWFLGYPGSATLHCQQLVDGKWQSHGSLVNVNAANPWTPLRPMESLMIIASPISEKATEIRVAVPFTSERLTPNKVHWVFSPTARIVKRGQDYFPETKPGAKQEEQVQSLTRPGALTMP